MSSIIAKYIGNLGKYKWLLYELVMRDIKLKYKRSILGLLWSLLNPLFMMVIITIVFSSIFRFDIKNFPIYLLSGQIIFTFMSEATSMAMVSIIGGGQLIKKVYIPKYIFPFSKVISSFVNLLFALIAVVIVMIVTHVKLTFVLFLFPISLIYILVFSIGLGLILSTCAIFFRDMVHLYGVIITAWSYFTPLFYPISIIPKKYLIFIKLNPMYYYIEHFREIVLYARIPSLRLNLMCITMSIIMLFLGLIVFYKNQDKFILYI